MKKKCINIKKKILELRYTGEYNVVVNRTC